MLLESGNYSEVHVITDLKNDQYAIKIYKKKDLDHFKNEVKILKDLNHSNIIFMFKYNSSFKQDYVLLEYCKGGDLLSYINDYYEKNNDTISLTQVKLIFKQILEGVQYLHSRNICHRDLKLENVLIYDIKDDTINQIKICDFGFSTKNDNYCKIYSGTLEYNAPEIDKSDFPDGFKIDIWALGIILYILLKFEYPFTNSKHLEICSIINLETISYLGKMLNNNPFIRSDISEILLDSWLNITNKRKLESTEIVPER
tara:strand:+ start:1696 stop:2466 length:771 start_codon:yes stop_codon:yes gene_type:complete